jgi:hypothetical protein
MLRQVFGGLEQPKSATMEEWNQYHRDAKAKNALIDWVAGKGLTKLQNLVYFPHDVIYAVRIYFTNRFIDKAHYLPSRLTPGEWYDIDHRMMHSMFEALVDYVEVEKAWMVIANDETGKYKTPWWTAHHLLRWGRLPRGPEAGLEHLNWEMSLTGEDQRHADIAKEQCALYMWWKYERDLRVEPYDLKHLTHEQRYTLHQKYEQEDEQMMIRLIKIRKSLWT